MTSPRAILRGLWLAVLTGLLVASPVRGHAVLLRSSPPAGTRLEGSPRQVVLLFSEAVHPGLSTGEVLDPSGKVRSLRSEVAGDGRTLRILLPPLPKGSYVARWRVLSRVDGHLTTGMLGFGVGVMPNRGGTESDRPPPLRVGIRWVAYTAQVSLAGLAAFWHLVLRPLGTALPEPADAAFRRIPRAAALAVLATTGLEVALLLGGLSLALGVQLLTSGPSGWALILRMGAAGVFLGPDAIRKRWSLPVVALLLLASTLSSHAWGDGALAALADWTHLAAASVWMGGLVGLLILLGAGRAYRTHAAQATLRYSRWAGWSLLVVVLTGAYMAARELPLPGGSLGTEWGTWLLGKLALVAALVALGVVNRYRNVPQLASGTPRERALLRIRRVTRAEAVLGAAVLLAVGVLTITPTARTVQMRTLPPRTLTLAAVSDGLQVVLRVTPGEPGWNRFEVALRGPDGAPVDADRVMVRLWKLDEETLPTTVRLSREGPGRYAEEGGELGLAGYWQAEVVLRWRGKPDVSASFPLRAGEFSLRSELEAFRILRRAREAMEASRTWREVEQITDGSGNVVVTRYSFQKPDRVRFEVQGGMRAILVGRDRYVWTGRGWSRDTLPEPFVAQGVAGYMRNPARAQVGRRASCGEEPCRVVLWESPDGLASFAAWIGERTHRPMKLLMSAPAHYMHTQLQDFDGAEEVRSP